MTEILVVIGLIVLMLGLAVPAFNLIRGGRSIDSAQNQVAAMIGKARSDAIGLQQIHGVMFFLDPASDRVNVAEVYATDYPAANGDRDVYLDLAPDTDFLPLPHGVLAFVLCNGTVNAAGTRTSDGYLGYNTIFGTFNNIGVSPGGAATGGVILFNGEGQLISRSYGYTTVLNTVNTAMQTQIIGLAGANGFVDAGPGGATTTIMSAMGFALCDYQAFKSNGDKPDPLFTGTPIAPPTSPMKNNGSTTTAAS